MEDRDYRSEVGKKIEEALAMGDFDLVEDLIEVPPMETFMQWAEKGEEKRKKRILRKRILVSCIAVVVVSASVLIGLKCFALPEVTADPDSGIDIELNDMESVVTYKSWDALPNEIKEQFIEVKDLPEGCVVEKIEVSGGGFAEKLAIYINKGKEKIELKQYINTDGSLPTSTMSSDNEEFIINDSIVYVEKHKEYKTKTYKYLMGDMGIEIIISEGISGDIIEEIIKTVQ